MAEADPVTGHAGTGNPISSTAISRLAVYEACIFIDTSMGRYCYQRPCHASMSCWKSLSEEEKMVVDSQCSSKIIGFVRADLFCPRARLEGFNDFLPQLGLDSLTV